ncbi:uncharacterized protein F5Z01DRAFT_300937 [Emericellopsis atlantica]|uniref:Uncharacterized protein n=1 Tax=Emericellopsis atlantica TaxID=2614577 RepID=A0A9P7ZGV7_9HYPO|nr:uncharacterized protein F5Z01DRAFT_300937 [Emericellopsis atlantica]KAG9251223.1 hypothetical protein F5Z01DRAFT_300937 [Emericellopsis atlantica]
MAAQQVSNLDDLVRAVERHHEQYIKSLRALHDNVGGRRRERSDTQHTVSEAFVSPARAPTGPVFSAASSHQTITRPAARRSTLDAPERPVLGHSSSPSPRLFPSTLRLSDGTFPGHDEDLNFIRLLDSTPNLQPNKPTSIPPPDETPRTTKTLTPLAFADDMLLKHLRDSEFWGETQHLLEDVLKRREDIDTAQPFRDFAAFEREGYLSATFEVYDVDADAKATKISTDVDVQGVVKYAGDGPFDMQDEIVDAPMVWECIKDVNHKGESVGRITIVQEPTPLIMAALHLTMSPHFDMSELIHHFLSEVPHRGRTHACLHRAFEKDPYPLTAPVPQPAISTARLRQRSFFFAFKYYTVVGDGLEPAPWQRFDKRPSDKRTGDHVDIAECGSILALSLEGEPTKPLRIRPRRERTKEGFLFDTFGAWHLLSIQSFPDDEHTVRGEEFQQKSFYNGPYAFLDLLVAEFRDAGKRNQILHERITKLITPPTDFMFDRRLRDKLLFEDKHFTYIRRYFWAYNTLAVINTGLKAMIASYFDTFTDEFWAGTHPLLWPIPSSLTPEAADAYRDKMGLLRKELEKVVSDLGEVLNRNERTRKEIENLRDQLFSGSSIKESRRAIDQGDNIRILTMISMIFLPLTFVTSVFGMTDFDIPANDWRFALVMVLVCVPFTILILLLQTRTFTLVLRKIAALSKKVASLPVALHARMREPKEAVQDNWSTAPVAVKPTMGRKRRLMALEVESKEKGLWPWNGWLAGREDDGAKP